MNRAVQMAMMEAGLTADTLAGKVGVDPKTAARWMNPGLVPQTRHRAQVAKLLGREMEDLWPGALRRREPVWFLPWTQIEREAAGLRWYESSVIPGLLQTETYARAVLACGPLVGDAERHVAVRLERQAAVFDRPQPPLTVFVIDEAALRRGAPEIMGPQLDHLVMLAQRPNLMVHVLPLAAGLHPGQAGQFVIASMPDGEDVGYLDDQAEGRVTKEVSPLWAVWDTVRSVALPRDQSIDFLRERAWLT
ncbi:DUF5753 domain-containing protein [Micromonospora endophytica]|uniref:DUF5753 domain-containing protein n=1 Tax=Micromonospora endophytica TaxID=515350 RepID=A0A2W2B4X9_9ACTN|nr:DUF5753 domain-containing protein [Micromonospora endophytica]PZF82481.1 hypothetical protein C1I93_30585 [Micromonospora endophytica]RIW42462.1 XRE family transcriptional regulator [Micromonospora endophytica]BCJ57679.1 transcriptional regulator [Micromonospora endophytica]